MCNQTNSIWTEARVENLKGMWLAGLSGSEIAASMGVTRCAALGKVHRLKLDKRDCDHNRTFSRKTPEELEATKRNKEERRRERRRTQRVNTVKPTVNLEALRCIEVEPLHKHLLELGPNDCRYPYGDSPYTFCGHPQMEGHSYCGPHFSLSVRREWRS